MSSKRRLRRISCAKKRPYTREEAYGKAGMLRKRGIEIYPYECNFGRHWHVGHRPNKVARQIDFDSGYTSLLSVGRFRKL